MDRAARRLGWVATAVLVVALAACGGSGAARSDKTLRPAQALVLARAVNLTPGDLPGFSAGTTPKPASPGGGPTGFLPGCSDLEPNTTDVADSDSPSFETGTADGYQTIGSSVSVMPSATVARRDVALALTSRGRACVVKVLGSGVLDRPGGPAFGPITVVPLPVRWAGTTVAAGLRITVTETLYGVHVAYITDQLDAAVGSAEISLMASGLTKPVPAATEQRLFALLVQRADAATS